jgi:hypothetical protein
LPRLPFPTTRSYTSGEIERARSTLDHMSPAGFVVLVVVGTSDPNVTSAIADALGAALAPEGFSVEREAGSAEAAAGEVLVEWGGAPGRGARVRVQRTGRDRSVERRVDFAAADPPRERGRLVGLIAGAIWSALLVGEGPRSAQPVPPDVTPAAALSVGPGPVQAGRIVPGNRTVDVAAVATTGIGGVAGRWGVSLVGRWQPRGGRLGWRAGLDARAGEMAAALATVYTVVAGLGGSVTLVEARAERPFALDLRADLLAVGEIVSHLSSDDRSAVRRQRWLPGASAGVDLGWSLSPSLGLLLGAGAEVTSGPTDVVVREERVATIAPWRAVARAGLRARF